MAMLPSPFPLCHTPVSSSLRLSRLSSAPNPPPPHALGGSARPLRSGAPPLKAKADLLALLADQERGLRTQSDPNKRAEIVAAIEMLGTIGYDQVTTGPSLSGTWRMLWTTEKEQLFIIKNAYLFGTRTGDVLQVIDVENGSLSNVITFPPSGVFFVRSTIEVAPPQRVNFRFTSAVLRGSNWEIPLPPFGQGWFESIYLDDNIRVVKDIRGDYLVVDRAPYSWFDSIYLDDEIRVAKDIRGDYLVVDRAPYSWKE